MVTDTCKICGNTDITKCEVSGDYFDQTCRLCGSFKISGTAATQEITGDRILQKLRGYIHQYGSASSPVLINSETVRQLNESPFPTVTERAEFLLKSLHASTTYLGQKINVLNNKSFLALTYSLIENDLVFLSNYLEAEGLVEKKLSMSSLELSVSPKGFVLFENQSSLTSETNGNAFAAMWFSDEVHDAWEFAIKPAIKSCGYQPIRIDKVHHHEKIDDQILRHIRESDFVVADLTGHRGGVYFEAGFALALGKPVIWTCRSDCFADTHFDVNHYHIIKWDTPEELKGLLEDKLIALFGKGNKEL